MLWNKFWDYLIFAYFTSNLNHLFSLVAIMFPYSESLIIMVNSLVSIPTIVPSAEGKK